MWEYHPPLGDQASMVYCSKVRDVHWRDRISLMGRVFPMTAIVIKVLFGRDSCVSIDERTGPVNLQLEPDRDELMEQVRPAEILQRLLEGAQLRMEE